jgi:chromosomal replication initiator protein
MNAQQAWQAARGQLQLEMPKAAFDTWVRNAEYISYEDGSFIIGVPNAYARDWLQSRLSSTVTRLLTGIMNRTVEVRFIIWQNGHEPNEVKENTAEIEEITFSASNPSLNARYSFENFVVGPSNRLAHAASLAVAENRLRLITPLLVWRRWPGQTTSYMQLVIMPSPRLAGALRLFGRVYK